MTPEEIFDYEISHGTDVFIADALQKNNGAWDSDHKFRNSHEEQLSFFIASIARSLNQISLTLNEINNKLDKD